jgi:hypothetical protein
MGAVNAYGLVRPSDDPMEGESVIMGGDRSLGMRRDRCQTRES